MQGAEWFGASKQTEAMPGPFLCASCCRAPSAHPPGSGRSRTLPPASTSPLSAPRAALPAARKTRGSSSHRGPDGHSHGADPHPAPNPPEHSQSRIRVPTDTSRTSHLGEVLFTQLWYLTIPTLQTLRKTNWGKIQLSVISNKQLNSTCLRQRNLLFHSNDRSDPPVLYGGDIVLAGRRKESNSHTNSHPCYLTVNLRLNVNKRERGALVLTWNTTRDFSSRYWEMDVPTTMPLSRKQQILSEPGDRFPADLCLCR